jgi:predicted Rossmann fold nucleotide-binding protein DprA/Smf involved in DNA uptake
LPAATDEPVTPESRLEAALGSLPRDVTALAEASGAGVADTLARLLRLQWSGIAVSHPGGRWSRRGG